MWDMGWRMADGVAHLGDRLLCALPDIQLPTTYILHGLAYRPFLDPAPIDRYWLWLLPPLILLVALVYRAIKTEDLRQLPKSAGYLAMQIALFMLLATVGLYVMLLIG
jgi:hypothetical protein